MKTIILTQLVLIIILIEACSGARSAQQNSSTLYGAAPLITNNSTPVTTKDDGWRRGLEAQFAQIAAPAKGRVGVAARVIETGQEASLNPSEHFPMHSVYKLPIAMAVLRRVDDGQLKLDQKVKVEKSDFVRAGMYSP